MWGWPCPRRRVRYGRAQPSARTARGALGRWGDFGTAVAQDGQALCQYGSGHPQSARRRLTDGKPCTTLAGKRLEARPSAGEVLGAQGDGLGRAEEQVRQRACSAPLMVLGGSRLIA